MDRLRRPKIRDQAAEQIRKYILDRNLGPGDRLPSELQLAESFGISRLTVREATKALEFLGIVESKTGVGLTVGQIDMGRVTDHLAFHPRFKGLDAEQLIDSRVIIEVGVLPHVARRMKSDPSIQQKLQGVIDRFPKSRDLKSWIELDIEFHRTLLESSGLDPLIAFGDLLSIFFRRFRESVAKAEWKDSIDSHQRIVDCLAAGIVNDAVKTLRHHIESHKERQL
jgi:GntR family transcriptional repressor for pyruvate dehydrogenase complex